MNARFNEDPAVLAGAPDYPTLISVEVRLREPQLNGMPAGAEIQQLDLLESTIIDLLDGRGVCASVITTGGIREFVIYSQGWDWIAAFEEQLRRTIHSHDVRVTEQHEPGLAPYNQFVAQLMRRMG